MIKAIKADLYFRIGQNKTAKCYFEESVSFFDRAISLSKKPDGIFLHKALSLSNLKRYEDSVSTLKRAIDISPGNSSYFLFLGIIHYDNHKPDDAIDCFNKVLELSPDNSYAECYKYLSCLLLNEKDIESLENLSRKIQFSNAEFKARYLIHCEKFLFQHKQDSMSYEVRQFYEDFLGAHRDKTMLAMDRTSIKDVNFIKKILIVLKPQYYKLHYQFKLALKQLFAGNIDKAQEDLQLILDANPHFEEALSIFMDICLYKNETDLSIKYLRKIDTYNETLNILEQNYSNISGQRIDPSVALILGILFTHKGVYEKAIKLLKMCVSDSNKNFYPFYCLGRSYLYSKEERKAFKYFKLAMDRLHKSFLETRLNEYKRILTR